MIILTNTQNKIWNFFNFKKTNRKIGLMPITKSCYVTITFRCHSAFSLWSIHRDENVRTLVTEQTHTCTRTQTHTMWFVLFSLSLSFDLTTALVLKWKNIVRCQIFSFYSVLINNPRRKIKFLTRNYKQMCDHQLHGQKKILYTFSRFAYLFNVLLAVFVRVCAWS